MSTFGGFSVGAWLPVGWFGLMLVEGTSATGCLDGADDVRGMGFMIPLVEFDVEAGSTQ